MRASHRPGAVSSDSVGTIDSSDHSRFNCSNEPSLRSSTPRQKATPVS